MKRKYEEFKVYLECAGALDEERKELLKLLYISSEKQLGDQHHKKVGAMNSITSLNINCADKCTIPVES
ncbi:Cellulose synthase [Dillenia turbinata]|uniref:Cellulose synthase n=1 Tax=Dillenia turbinata TaxID=194707 RepID=A0AAN8VZM1_9MAGN